MPKSQRLQLTARFPDLIARAGLSQRAFARRAGVSFSTIMGLLHPELHPGRRGGMQRSLRSVSRYEQLADADRRSDEYGYGVMAQ